MATTATYSASLRTRKKNSSSNYRSGAANQEFYTAGDNFVGILCFSGMSLTGKVITAASLTVKSAQAGYGASHTKTVYFRKATHQGYIWEGITGQEYAGDELGTFTGSFYGNTTTVTFSGTLLDNLASYVAAGNNTFTIYNPNPVAGSQGYSTNYLQWSTATMTSHMRKRHLPPHLPRPLWSWEVRLPSQRTGQAIWQPIH